MGAFHGRIPCNFLDHKIGINSIQNFLETTEFAEELQQRTEMFIDQTKKNIYKSSSSKKHTMTEKPKQLAQKKITTSLF